MILTDLSLRKYDYIDLINITNITLHFILENKL